MEHPDWIDCLFEFVMPSLLCFLFHYCEDGAEIERVVCNAFARLFNYDELPDLYRDPQMICFQTATPEGYQAFHTFFHAFNNPVNRYFVHDYRCASVHFCVFGFPRDELPLLANNGQVVQGAAW